jgi:hypothetical protein
MATQQTRPLSAIARDIGQHWHNVSPYAAPYLEAMRSLGSIESNYFQDSAESIVLYFLSNASAFRGPEARRIKAELKGIVK